MNIKELNEYQRTLVTTCGTDAIYMYKTNKTDIDGWFQYAKTMTVHDCIEAAKAYKKYLKESLIPECDKRMREYCRTEEKYMGVYDFDYWYGVKEKALDSTIPAINCYIKKMMPLLSEQRFIIVNAQRCGFMFDLDDEYISLLKKFDIRKEDADNSVYTIKLNSITDLCSLSETVGHDIIYQRTLLEDGFDTLIIYDGYLE